MAHESQLDPGMKIPQACVVCGIPFGVKSGLCGHCAAKLFALREPTAREDAGLAVRSLFAWERDGFPAHRSIVRKLKGREQPEPWLELASWMVHLMMPDGSSKSARRRRLLVPIPSTGPNHALGWARALSHWTGWPVADVLSKTAQTQSKQLNRFDRAKRAFLLKSGNEYTDVVIVDDIITTGATARAAYRALGRPRNCEVWCLMDRRPWQGEGSLL